MIQNTLVESIEKLLRFEHKDPFAILGPHPVSTGRSQKIAIRAVLPGIHSASIVAQDKNDEYPMYQVGNSHVFEAICDRREQFPYKIKITYRNSFMEFVDDPYSFDPGFGDLDLHLLREGSHHRSFEKLGAHVVYANGVKGVRFAVWAPNARSVSVIGSFNGWDRRRHMMQKIESIGIWSIFIPGLVEGTGYKYQINTKQGFVVDKSDPYAFFAEESPQTASIVANINNYLWNDHAWMEKRNQANDKDQPIAIYEVHLGSWAKKENGDFFSYRELAETLVDYVVYMGYTHIEILPVQEHPFYGSWGYQALGHYAPTSRYGTPEDFMYFVDRCHQKNIGVILDWVPAHFPKDAHGLALFDGSHLYEHSDPLQRENKDWKTFIYNFARYEVKNFLISNALFWLEKYHLDGLRVDAVTSMLYLDYCKGPGEWAPNRFGGRENLEAVEFLQELNQTIHDYHPGVMIIAEESSSWPKVSGPVYLGGLGFDYKWNMGWMNDILKYMSTDPIYRKYQHQSLSFSIWYAFDENFILALSHDEVVHGKYSMIKKMPGEMMDQFANVRLLYGYMYAHPGKKLLFMGGEFGQWREWNHDAGLDWDLLQHEPHQKLQKYVRALNQMYRDNPCLYEKDHDSEGFKWVDYHDADCSVIAFWRRCRSEALLFVFNFTPVTREGYILGVEKGGTYYEVFNSDAAEFGGGNAGNLGEVTAYDYAWQDKPCHLSITIPPLSMIVFRRDGDPLEDIEEDSTETSDMDIVVEAIPQTATEETAEEKPLEEIEKPEEKDTEKSVPEEKDTEKSVPEEKDTEKSAPQKEETKEASVEETIAEKPEEKETPVDAKLKDTPSEIDKQKDTDQKESEKETTSISEEKPQEDNSKKDKPKPKAKPKKKDGKKSTKAKKKGKK